MSLYCLTRILTVSRSLFVIFDAAIIAEIAQMCGAYMQDCGSFGMSNEKPLTEQFIKSTPYTFRDLRRYGFLDHVSTYLCKKLFVTSA